MNTVITTSQEEDLPQNIPRRHRYGIPLHFLAPGTTFIPLPHKL
jgi:hypothetical protein